MNGSKLPHHLRIIILLLRLELGVNFLYLNAAMALPAFKTVSAWVFIAIGICLIAGLFTRVAAIAGIALTAASYAPALNLAAFNPSNLSGLANQGVLVAICLLIIIFSNAGAYIGLDKFIHIHLSRKHK